MEPQRFVYFLISIIGGEELRDALAFRGKRANVTMGRVGDCLQIII